MKFTKIRLVALGVTDLPIVGALPSDRYILKSAEGLGPTEIDVTIADTLNAGGVYQGKRPNNREVVLQIGLNPNQYTGETASDLRTELYGLLTPGALGYIQIEIRDGDTILGIATGYAKKLEINPFSKDPEIQVTIPCTQPYWSAEHVLYLDPGGTSLSPTIENVGSAPTGVHFEVVCTTSMSSFTITDATDSHMTFTYSFLAGDKLTFDTRPGFRDVTITRGSTTTSAISTLSSDSTWIMLYGGTNSFIMSTTSYTWGDVFYTPLYWGI